MDFTRPTLMITAWAGRFTPHASVAVHTIILIWPSAKSFSIRFLSLRTNPAWWIPIPAANSDCNSLLLPERMAFTAWR